jgi:hypothetical protein
MGKLAQKGTFCPFMDIGARQNQKSALLRGAFQARLGGSGRVFRKNEKMNKIKGLF